MSDLNYTNTITALVQGIRSEMSNGGVTTIGVEAVEMAMEGYDVGVSTPEAVVERICGREDWTFTETDGGFKIADARWKIETDNTQPDRTPQTEWDF
jgi:hypothetical protein